MQKEKVGLKRFIFAIRRKQTAASKLLDRFGVFRSLHDKIPTLLKQKVNSRTGNNNHLIALRLSSPQEEIIKLRNPTNPSKPGIVFRYSEQRHLSLEPAKENNSKRDYLTRAIRLGTTPLSDEELIDFLEHMRNATFGIVTVHNNNTHQGWFKPRFAVILYILYTLTNSTTVLDLRYE